MIGKPATRARTFGWVLLLIAGLALTLGSLGSAYIAYVQSGTPGTDPHIDRLRELDAEQTLAARGRRGTAAGWAAAFGLLFCFVASTAFRRGERWAWWAMLVSMGAGCLLILLRVPLLETQLGATTGLAFLAVLLLGVLIPVRDFWRE